MGTDLIRTDQRQLATLPGAQALRRIARLASIADGDVEQARSLVPADAGQLVQAARDEARMWLTPATRGDAKRFLAPTLALVAPSGMSTDDQTAWLAAAMDTLSGIPADLLERGCKAARLKVDHPAKIVAAIHADVGGEWDRRRTDLRSVGAVEALLAMPASSPAQYVAPAEAAAIIDEAGLRSDKPAAVPRVEGVARAPTPDEVRALFPNAPRDDATPVADITGMSIDQIFAQRDRLRAQRAADDRAADQRRKAARRSGEGVADELEDLDRYAA